METISQPSAAPLPNESRRQGRSVCGSGNGLMILAIVLGFVFAWPVGLALLAWAIWHPEIKKQLGPLITKLRDAGKKENASFQGFMARKPSNAALAEYLASEQQRLREEQEKLNELVREFEAYKAAQREASDRQDFEAFLKRHGGRGDGRDDSPSTASH